MCYQEGAYCTSLEFQGESTVTLYHYYQHELWYFSYRKTSAVNLKLLSFSHYTQINFSFFILNAFWLVTTFILQIFNSTFAISIPKLNLQLQKTGDVIKVEPVPFMFIMGFAVTVIIQFLAMLYHR